MRNIKEELLRMSKKASTDFVKQTLNQQDYDTLCAENEAMAISFDGFIEGLFYKANNKLNNLASLKIKDPKQLESIKEFNANEFSMLKHFFSAAIRDITIKYAVNYGFTVGLHKGAGAEIPKCDCSACQNNALYSEGGNS